MNAGQLLLVALAGVGTGLWLAGGNHDGPMMFDPFGVLPSSPSLGSLIPKFGARTPQPSQREAQQRGGGFGLPRGGEPGMPVTRREWQEKAAPYEGDPRYDSGANDPSYQPHCPGCRVCYWTGNGCEGGWKPTYHGGGR